MYVPVFMRSLLFKQHSDRLYDQSLTKCSLWYLTGWSTIKMKHIIYLYINHKFAYQFGDEPFLKNRLGKAGGGLQDPLAK